MTQKDLDKLFATVNKKSPNNNNWFTSINLTNVYLSRFFDGTEHDLVKKEYADCLFTRILEFLNQSRNLTKTNFMPDTLENFMYDIRKVTYKFRRDIFYRWINCITEKRNHFNPLIQSLVIFFPNISDMKAVKEQLGLNYSIE